MNNAARAKKVVLMKNWQSKAILETWDYEETRIRYREVVLSFLPGKPDFSDDELLDALSHLNSYCAFEILEVKEDQ